MPLAGLVVNRMQNANADDLSADQARAAAERIEDEDAMLASLLTMHAMRLDEAARQRRLVARFSGAHPIVPLRGVPALAQDVHDLEGLREIGALLGQPT
jgi:Asp-tRNA(Asn)/Glu-tRNA(Gln) amidotransferase A subunit family amidase